MVGCSSLPALTLLGSGMQASVFPNTSPARNSGQKCRRSWRQSDPAVRGLLSSADAKAGTTDQQKLELVNNYLTT
jgi:hypothetical protein